MNRTERPPEPPSPTRLRELRRFGLTMGIVALLAAAYLLWKAQPEAAAAFLLASTLLTALAAFRPRTLDGPERAWMRFAHALSVVSTFVILTFVFYLVVTPIGLILRMARQDVLALRPRPRSASYWEPVEPGGPSTRPYQPF